jgi:hypothetical protein
MANCLAGCGQYSCSSKAEKPITPGHSFAPFVKVRFGSRKDAEITVGNESSGVFNNHAIIKSFSYGISNGQEVSIEIVDEQGGAFRAVFDTIAKCLVNINQPIYQIAFSYGWVRVDCDGNKLTPIESPICKALVKKIDVTYQQGKAKYKVLSKSIMQATDVARENSIKGSDQSKISLEEAIILACKEQPPVLEPYKGIVTAKGEQKTEPFKDSKLWEFQNEKVIIDKFECKNQTKVQAMYDWLEPYITKKKKGIFVTADNIDPEKIIFWEQSDGKDCSVNVGTYIVNGGECSPVIDFNPTITWLPGVAAIPSQAGGNVHGSATAASGSKEPGINKNSVTEAQETQGENAGSTALFNPTDFGYNTHGPSDVHKKTNEARSKHADAARRYSGGGILPITADLVIIGDPGITKGFSVINQLVGRKVSIVFINPFYIGTKDGNDKQYLAIPGCNEILSNRGWQIQGVNHTIQEGKYTTTLKLYLTGPNLDHDSDQLGESGYQIKEGVCPGGKGGGGRGGGGGGNTFTAQPSIGV